MNNILVVVTIKPWNIKSFKKWDPPASFKKLLITDKKELTKENLENLNPKYIFFLHWSWIIPAEIYKNFTCIVFHMTDLPFGRGGSPLQNLLIRGIYKTKLSAIKVEAGLDSGPVYLKRDFDMSEGSAQEIFERAAKIDFEMMNDIIRKDLKPVPQKGKIVVFKRRTPNGSKLPHGLDARQLYDFIRMLDADSYPKAFLMGNGYRFEFMRAKFVDEHTETTVKIFPKEK